MKFCTLTILLVLSGSVAAQQQYDSSFHFYYYDQKLSFFEQMPVKKGCVVWLGDSITDSGEWNELFPDQCNLNRGISADNTFGLLHRLPEVVRHQPSRLYLLIGINDVARNIPVEVTLRNYRRIVETLRRDCAATRIYIQGLMPTNNAFTQFPNHQNKRGQVQAINKELEALCRELQVHYIDLFSAFADVEGNLDARYTNDGLHLTGAGYARWKEVVLGIE
ncbi:MAG TPA: GDSL-type esterase/lipase family protein [Lacibacter sp.]|nr:GDSL-type esterase/lipase family protein [Lacibacter sp.]HMO89151.1 GDSL-type esterase/lipase family protein [Lacibacter sp.]